MGKLYIPKRYAGFNIVTIKDLESRDDAILSSDNDSGKIVELNPKKNNPPHRSPCGKYDSVTSNTQYHILVSIPPQTITEIDEEGKMTNRNIFTKVKSQVKERWVSTDGKSWDKLYLFR